MVVGGKEPQQQDKASVMKQTAELWLRQEVEQLKCEADDRDDGGVFVLDGSVLLSHLGRPPLLEAGGARRGRPPARPVEEGRARGAGGDQVGWSESWAAVTAGCGQRKRKRGWRQVEGRPARSPSHPPDRGPRPVYQAGGPD